jgi:hypothetical protein
VWTAPEGAGPGPGPTPSETTTESFGDGEEPPLKGEDAILAGALVGGIFLVTVIVMLVLVCARRR